jgi:hypothetical protein
LELRKSSIIRNNFRRIPKKYQSNAFISVTCNYTGILATFGILFLSGVVLATIHSKNICKQSEEWEDSYDVLNGCLQLPSIMNNVAMIQIGT